MAFTPPLSNCSLMSGTPAAASRVGSQSMWWRIWLETTPAGTWFGQRTMAGTRQPPSQLVFFSPRNGVCPASGQLFMCGPLSVL
ncbi:hypothetical protein D3C84_778060 [compost metagenome]